MILVSGGTGFVGSAVVRELRRRGEDVAVLSRDAEKVRAKFGADVEARTGDVREPATLTAAFSGVDVVVNAVQFPGSPIENRRKGWTFEEVDLKGTRHQVDAAKAAGVRRFVYVSGVGASKDADKHWFRYKWEAEHYLQSSGLEWVVVRPTWVYGPDDVSLNRFLGFGKVLPFIPMFGDGKQDMQPVFIDDVGRVLADAAQKPEAANQVFELGGPEVMSMNDVVKTALEVQGKKRPLLHQPVFVGKLIGSLPHVPPLPALTADAIDFITAPAVADNTRLMEVLRPQLTPLREGLATYLGKP
ncbi:MAG TPA: NAD(P)H-binding protein [Dehalococcoidia bacterium]|nr:NAD(P)H-binding protein [Dehalococcoidia bacterium]